MLKSKFFAGFIITYNRPDILKGSIEKTFAQTFPPEKIWIIDNSEGSETKDLIQSLEHYPLAYIHMGYNAGPAGAAAKGLELVAADGYDWIYWGDDDDPPPTLDTFERLFDSLTKSAFSNQIGQLGIVGQQFDSKWGLIVRTSDQALKDKEAVFVDTISGGMSKLIRSEVVKQGTSVERKLFFGFEELDFDLQLKKLGFLSLVPTDLFTMQRNRKGRSAHIQKKLLSQESLSRQYYSTRNLLFILVKHKLYLALTFTLIRKLFKLILEFRKGFSYGLISAKYTSFGLYHWLINKYGKQT